MNVEDTNINKINNILVSDIENINGYEFSIGPGPDPQLNWINCQFGSSSCIPIGSTNVWTSGTSISNSYANNYSLYADASGVSYATAYYYYDFQVSSPYHQWDSGTWVSSGVCLWSYSSTTSQSTCTIACSSIVGSTYYQNGGLFQSAPAAGDYCYTNSSGTSPLAAGTYSNGTVCYVITGSLGYCSTVTTCVSLTSFSIDTNGYESSGEACSARVSNVTRYHDGAGSEPTTNDTVYTDSGGTTTYNGGSHWRKMPSGYVIVINSSGLVTNGEGCV